MNLLVHHIIDEFEDRSTVYRLEVHINVKTLEPSYWIIYIKETQTTGPLYETFEGA